MKKIVKIFNNFIKRQYSKLRIKQMISLISAILANTQ